MDAWNLVRTPVVFPVVIITNTYFFTTTLLFMLSGPQQLQWLWAWVELWSAEKLQFLISAWPKERAWVLYFCWRIPPAQGFPSPSSTGLGL